MNKKVAIGAGVAALLMVVCVASVFATNWDEYMNYDDPQDIPFDDVVIDNGGDQSLDPSSLNYALFEKYGPLLLVLAVLMFGAMIGGVCIAREEGEHNDSD
jgi:NADH:ubiquinone oxidoreductase subunit 6 (subunit J)